MIIRKLNIRPRFGGRFGKSKVSRKNLSIVGGILLFFVLALGLPAIKIKSSANRAAKSAEELKTAFKKNDIVLVNKELDEFSKDYEKLRGDARLVYWASFIPYVADFKNGIEGGHYLLGAAKESIVAITPYADLIGFKKGEASFVEKSADDRLQTAILTLDKVLTRLDAVSEDIKKAEDHIKKINPNRYPKKFGKTVVRDRIITFKEGVLGVSTLFVDAKPLLKRLPEIMGKDEQKTYLVLFQNDKERRATGGFLTSYGVFTIKDGKIKKESSDDIYRLDESISSHPPAPDKIRKYHKGVYQLNIRDSNLSPDYPTSLKMFDELYQKSSAKVDYDGIVALDSKVLVDMLNIFGDTEAGGVVFSAKEDERCDCPQVLYTLFDIVDRPVNYIKADRKGILGQLLEALMFKVLGFSPSQYWGPFLENVFKNLDEKHILVYFKDPDLQASVEKLNYAGRIRKFDGDYLHVNNVNFAGAKSNLFVNEEITSRTKTSNSEREVEITFRNPYPHSDCNLERGGLCLNATLRNWMRVYVPKGSKLVSFDGSQTEVLTYDEAGKTVFEGFMTVSPKGVAKVKVVYTLPEGITRDYKLMIQKQPGVDEGQKLNVYVNGKEKYSDTFTKDLVVED